MRQVFLPEGHPEACAAQRRVVLNEALQLFVIHEVRLARPNIRVVQRLMYGERLRLMPLSVLEIAALLGDLADVDLRVEVGGESLVMVAGVAVDDVERVKLVEVVLGGVGREDARHAGVEAAAEDGGQAGLAEAILVGPLPTVFVFGFVERLIVGRVEVADAVFEAGVHDVEILIRQGEVDHQFGAEVLEEAHQFVLVVGVHLSRAYAYVLNVLRDAIAFALRAAGQHDVGKHIGIHSHFLHGNGAHAPGADD